MAWSYYTTLVLYFRMKGYPTLRVYFSASRTSINTPKQNKKTNLTSCYTYILDLIKVDG